MSTFELLNYIIPVGMILLSYFIIISIFGYIILYFIKSKLKNAIKTPKFLETFLVSFGMGVSAYLSICVLLNVFGVFNFYTAYLSFIFIDLLFSVFYALIHKKQIKERFSNVSVKSLINKEMIINFSIILFAIFLSLNLQWGILTSNKGLLAVDLYGWYRDTYLNLHTGEIQTRFLGPDYPQGYSIFIAGALLIYPSDIILFYLLKFLPIFYFILYILSSYSVISRFFKKKKYLIFFALILILSSRYYIFRSINAYPSVLAAILINISFIIILNKYPDFLIGFFLSVLFLIHVLSFLYFLAISFIFFFIRFLHSLKGRRFFLKRLFSTFSLLIVFILLIIPWIICIYLVYNRDLLFMIKGIFNYVEGYPINIKSKLYIKDDLSLLFFNNPNIRYLFNLEWLQPLGLIRYLTLDIFFVFSLFGLLIFYSKFKKTRNFRGIIFFFKIALTFIILIYIVSQLIPGWGFLLEYKARSLEIFTLPIVILATITIEIIINKLNKLALIIYSKSVTLRKFINTHPTSKKVLRIQFMLGLLSLYGAITIYERTIPPRYTFDFSDELTDIVLYIRVNAQERSKILGKPQETYLSIYRMLFDMYMKQWSSTEENDINEISNEIISYNPDYIIYKKNFFNESTYELMLNNFNLEVLIDNELYILFRVLT